MITSAFLSACQFAFSDYAVLMLKIMLIVPKRWLTPSLNPTEASDTDPLHLKIQKLESKLQQAIEDGRY